MAFQTAGTSLGEEVPVGNLVLVLTTAPATHWKAAPRSRSAPTNGSAENTDYDSASFPKTVTFTAGQGNGATPRPSASIRPATR